MHSQKKAIFCAESGITPYAAVLVRPHVRCYNARVSKSRKTKFTPRVSVEDTQSTSKIEDPSPFFEPLLRSIVVGAGVGATCEAIYTIQKVCDFLTDAALLRVGEAIPYFLSTFSPWFVGDHVAAISVCGVLYTIEVLAILAVLRQSPTDPVPSPDHWVNFPKKIFPWKFTPAKAFVAKLAGLQARAAAIAAPVVEKEARPTVQAVPPPSMVRLPDPIQQEVDSDLEKDWLRRKQELVERESYLTNFWYAVAISDHVSREPKSVEILGMKVVLFRDKNGNVHCLRDVCPHRSAPLSQGWMTTKNNKRCIVCPYHGWAFDGDGVIQHIPTTDKLPKKAQVEKFVVEDLGGFVWLFYEHPFGSKLPAEERPPIPVIPEFEDPKWRAVYTELEFNCGHWSVFENAMDLAHIHYIHADSFGNSSKPRIENLKVVKNAFGVDATCSVHNKTVNALWKFTEVDDVPVQTKAMLPSTSYMKISLGAGIEFITFVNTVPINKHRTINRFALLRNFLPWNAKVLDSWAENAMLKILKQDKAMVEQLTPELATSDLSVDVDLIQTMFRKLRHDYFKMGYGYYPLDD